MHAARCSVLRVRGIDGLRIADASVMPSIRGANINAPMLAIAQRAAAMIRGETWAKVT
jgi:choline dehydrogenase-like flavoprotein